MILGPKKKSIVKNYICYSINDATHLYCYRDGIMQLPGNPKFAIKGKLYKIIRVTGDRIIIDSEFSKEHRFQILDNKIGYKKYFHLIKKQ
jgi:hypothetical protein